MDCAIERWEVGRRGVDEFVSVRDIRRELCSVRIVDLRHGCELNGLREVRIEVVAAKKLGIAS